MKLRQLYALDTVFSENMYVGGHLHPGVGGAGRVVVVVARGDKHRHRHCPETFEQLPSGLLVAAVAVKQVTAHQHQIHVSLPRQSGYGIEQPSLLTPAQCGLGRTQTFKRGVKVQIGRVQYFYLSHVSLCASVPMQRPVSGSISNMQHSITHLPFADS